MTDLLNLRGEICTVGDLRLEDLQPMVDVPGVLLRMPDGRIITLSGLTREECQACSAAIESAASFRVTA